MLRPLYISLLLLCAATALHAEDAKVAEEHRNAGIVALQESQARPREIVAAARHFAKAAALFEKVGDADGTVEMNSFLYWCKKKMTLDDIEAFSKAGEAIVTEKLKALDTQKVAKTDAQTWYDRAEAFAKAKPDEHLLIAVRFFEVAERFIGTELSVQAQRRSLDEMQLATAAAPRKPEVAPVAPVAVKPIGSKALMPDAAKLKEAEKSIKDIFKDEYAKRGLEDRKTLGQKLLHQGKETADDLAAQFVLYKESALTAAQAGDLETTTRAIEALTKTFVTDTALLKLEVFAKASAGVTHADQAKALARQYVVAASEASAEENLDAALKMLTAADALARKSQDVQLVGQIASRTKDVRALQAEYLKVKTAKQTLKDKPEDPLANLTVGKFLCFVSGAWEEGLPLLLKCSDLVLKANAEKDLADPKEAKDQAALGDAWWDISEKLGAPSKAKVQARASLWYGKALQGLTGIAKTRLEKRLMDASTIVIGTKKVTLRDNLITVFKDDPAVLKLKDIGFENAQLKGWLKPEDDEIAKNFVVLGHPVATITLNLATPPSQVLVLEAATHTNSGGVDVEAKCGDKVVLSKRALQKTRFGRYAVNLNGVASDEPIVFTFTAMGSWYNSFYIKSLHYDFPQK